MASREKRPLAPSKSKHKANNDSGLPSTDSRSKKGKSLPTPRQQQLARDILEAVATVSQLPPKLEASLPRKKVLKNLKRKQKLRAVKANLIKVKVAKKVPIKSLRRINPDVKKGVKPKKLRRSEDTDTKISEVSTKALESDNEENAEGLARGTKNNLRAKRTKTLKGTEEIDTAEPEDKEVETGGNIKTSPKSGRRVKTITRKSTNIEPDFTEDNKSVDAKLIKLTGLKRNTSKDRESLPKVSEVEIRSPKGKRSLKEVEIIGAVRAGGATETRARSLVDKNSVDLTIDEVIASMIGDPDLEDHQRAVEKIEGKLTRSRKTLLGEKLLSEGEIKKEPDFDEGKTASEEECVEGEEDIQQQKLRKRSNVGLTSRSLRNGKLRQLSDSGIPAELDVKKRRRLNSDDPVISDTCAESVSDDNMDAESCFYESSAGESQDGAGKNEVSAIKDDMQKSFEDALENGAEIENNNNSERGDRPGEVGPTLRSKTKARNSENDTKVEDTKDDLKVLSKSSEAQDDAKKSSNAEQPRKDAVLAKLADKPKSRRSSLNLEMKKTVSSFYGNEKSDGNSKSQIDQMIENIKLTIAKSIESKIFGPEKSLSLNKNFEVPKIEEIVAPLSAESQKLGLDDNTEEDKPNISKNESKSEGSENSVPKVADTAKEIEKLVMGDMELVDTQSQKTQESELSNVDIARGFSEVDSADRNCASFSKSMDNDCQEDKNQSSSTNVNVLDSKPEDQNEDEEDKNLESGRKAVSTRKSMRIIDKSSSDSSIDSGTRKSSRILDKNAQKCTDSKELEIDSQGTDSQELNEGVPTYENFKRDIKSKELASSNAKSTDSNENLAETLSSTATVSDNLLEEHSLPNPSGSETDTCLNTSLRSDESETLESISREVERLVAESSANQETPKNSINSEQSPNVDTTEKETKESENMEEVEEKDDDPIDSETDAEANRYLEALETSFADSDALAVANEISEVLDEEKIHQNESDGSIETQNENKDSRETNGATKTLRNHCHSSTTNGCDTNSENSIKNLAQNSSLPSKEKVTDTESTEITEVAEDADKSVVSNLSINANVPSELSLGKQKNNQDLVVEMVIDNEKSVNEKNTDEQKSTNEETRRVLRTRDRQKKIETRQKSRSIERSEVKVKIEEDIVQMDMDDNQGSSSEERATPESRTNPRADAESGQITVKVDAEPQIRTRRSREVKRRKEDQQQQQQSTIKSKRSKRDTRKSDQQNKEETLLDNEVAKINENNRSHVSKYGKSLEDSENFRGFSEGGRARGNKVEDVVETIRSKSENDLESVQNESESSGTLSRTRPDSHTPKQTDNIDATSDSECKVTKTPETSQKDSDEASTSGESSSSAGLTSKILETPEDKAKKESILRLLGLESLEKAAERMNHQKAKKEQYTGTLKTVIRVQKEKDKDKKRSRSPLKMVLKQGRGDGDGDSPEFYTIQKEFGTSGLGDSSSGANRKFTTNHRHSCDEDNEEVPSKDRQSLVIPEKSSSFSIHPGRLCADVCCYCFGKFGSLDTPMHLAQMRSDERRKKILNAERHLTKDSCLCDACYRHVDRKANTSPTNLQTKPQRRQLMVTKCTARDCREPARHHVKRWWLFKIKAGLQNQTHVDIDWESTQHTSPSFCVNHYSKIEKFLTCALCKRRLVRNHTHQLVTAETDELNQRLRQQGIPVLLTTDTFVCKLCRYFAQLQLKYKDVENMNANHRSFCKSYRKRILHCLEIDVLENEEEETAQGQSTKEKSKRKKNKCSQQSKNSSFKLPDGTNNSTSEKSTPEPSKNEGTNSETSSENRTKANPSEETMQTDVQVLSIENNEENLKKRKSIDSQVYPGNLSLASDGSNEVVEILAMDREVTLTRLPKRPKTNNDINPVVQRLGANPSISVRTLFPGEEEMNLHTNIEFNNVREVTPQGWEKCTTMIQYDRDTKILWQELQRPYGNQSSFLRHLILLEKYYRSGDLVLAPNASRNAINYSTSVQNRLISYEGPEKMDEPIMEPISAEYSNSRRLSGGYVLERDRLSLPSTSSLISAGYNLPGTSQSAKSSPPRVLKLNPGVSIIKKPPPNLQRLSFPSTSATNGALRRKEGNKVSVTSGGKVFQLSEPDFKRLQTLKRQKQLLNEKQSQNPGSSSGTSSSPTGPKPPTQYQKAQIAAQTQFQKHLRIQQEMLSRQSRSDFEPLICDVRSASNENSSSTPTQNLLSNLNLPKSIQVTTKPPNPIPILPKIPKSLTVIPQTVPRPADK
ncbi:titin homolog isoform X2 [Cephus cinctus]|nr:titin homolog isoform X2 [Cephus cinctus]